jgi:large conductance mechanosensitive channel
MKKLISEFKEFISRGSVVDLAVGIIIGSAFTAIVTSLVNDVIMPLISLITGGLDFSMWNIALTSDPEGPVFAMGSFIAAVINFIIVAFVIFMLVKALNKFNRKKDEAPAAPTTKKCPYCLSEIPIEATKCAHCTSVLPADDK